MCLSLTTNKRGHLGTPIVNKNGMAALGCLGNPSNRQPIIIQDSADPVYYHMSITKPEQVQTLLCKSYHHKSYHHFPIDSCPTGANLG